MWVLKGLLLGLLIFSIVFVTRYHREVFHAILAPDVINGMTIENWFCWMGLVGSLLLGLSIVGWWSPAAWPKTVQKFVSR